MNTAAPETIVFVSNSPALALGLDLLLDRFAVVCADDTSIVDQLEAQGVPVFCLARQAPPGPSRSRNSGELLAREEAQRFIHSLGPASVLVFKNSALIEQICREQGWKLLASQALTARQFENKLHFPQVLQELGLAHPPRLERRAGDLTLEAIRQELGLPAVLQYAKGFSGRETYFIESQEDLAAAQAGNENRQAKCTAYIPGHTLTVNACLTPFGVLCSHPFLQITGLPELTRYRLGSCGQDWAYLPVPEAVLEQVRGATLRIGAYFAGRGYRGVFGLDFQVDEAGENLYVIETNPRLVASIPVFTDLQLARGDLPLLLWHLHAFGWEGDGQVEFSPESFERSDQALRATRPGSQIILHNVEDCDRIVRGALEAGIYTLVGGELRPVRAGLHLLNGPAAGEEFLVLPAGQGQVVRSGIECARLQFPHPALDGRDALSVYAARAAAAVYRALDLGPVD